MTIEKYPTNGIELNIVEKQIIDNYFGGIIFGLKRVEAIGLTCCLSVDKSFFFSSIETPGFNLHVDEIGLKGDNQKNG